MCHSALVLRVPDIVRNKALSAGAAHWLESLPGIVSELERAGTPLSRTAVWEILREEGLSRMPKPRAGKVEPKGRQLALFASRRLRCLSLVTRTDISGFLVELSSAILVVGLLREEPLLHFLTFRNLLPALRTHSHVCRFKTPASGV